MSEDEKYYEISYLLSGALAPDEAVAFGEKLREELTRRGASIDSWNSPSKRTLAYPVLDETEAYAGTVWLDASRQKIDELKRAVVNSKPVLRSLVVGWKRPRSPQRKTASSQPLPTEEQTISMDTNEKAIDQKLEEILGTTFNESQ